ncbi:MAG: MBL fold metallo-hydrolase [Ruminococcus sp.]|nr:MBL fold metallo-hydrolase [Ruminococcus sp.]
MKIIKLKPLSICGTNSYIVAGEKRNAVLIDAPDDSDYILSELKSHNLILKKILLTHGHFDHIGAVSKLADVTGCEVLVHEADLSKLSDISGNLISHFGLNKFNEYKNAKAFKDGDKIIMDELEFTVIHTPGHTSGSVCFVIGDDMFTGDTLFARSIGRTDMPDGNTMVMMQSLKKLASLSDNYNVYPGHMAATTLNEEKKYNPYMRGSFEDY